MEESGSEGLDELLMARKDTTFMKEVDFVCISDNYWLGKKKPCLTYGLRGICYFFVEVECCANDLHSGLFGGTVHEGMTDLFALMNTLVDKDGKILVDGVNDDVAPLTNDEVKTYKDIEFDVEDYRKDIGAEKLIHGQDKAKTLMARWRYPSLSLHGIEGAFYEPGSKTVIPRKVVGNARHVQLGVLLTRTRKTRSRRMQEEQEHLTALAYCKMTPNNMTNLQASFPSALFPT